MKPNRKITARLVRETSSSLIKFDISDRAAIAELIGAEDLAEMALANHTGIVAVVYCDAARVDKGIRWYLPELRRWPQHHHAVWVGPALIVGFKFARGECSLSSKLARSPLLLTYEDDVAPPKGDGTTRRTADVLAELDAIRELAA